MWLRYAKNFIDTRELTSDIFSIIESELEAHVSSYHLDQYKMIGEKIAELDEKFEKDPSDKSIRIQFEELHNLAYLFFKAIEKKLTKAVLSAEMKVADRFIDIENFPILELFYDSTEKSNLHGEYDHINNVLRINIFYFLINRKEEISKTLSHELVHWKQYFYDPRKYESHVDRIIDYVNPVTDYKIYYNIPYERQAHLSDILKELSSFAFEPGMDFDSFLENSPTWKRIKSQLYRENLLSMIKAIYSQLIKSK